MLAATSNANKKIFVLVPQSSVGTLIPEKVEIFFVRGMRLIM